MSFVSRLKSAWRGPKQTGSSKKSSGGKVDPLGITHSSLKAAGDSVDALVSLKKILEGIRDPSLIYEGNVMLTVTFKRPGSGYDTVSVNFKDHPYSLEKLQKLLTPLTRDVMERLHALGIGPDKLEGDSYTRDDEDLDNY